MNRIYHTWERWECYPAGFYDPQCKTRPAAEKEELEAEYARFLSSEPEFRAALERVITEWPRSCEHYLTNECMNRLAWLGQASACIALGIPSAFRAGFYRQSKTQQDRSNRVAFEYLNKWLVAHGEKPLPSIKDAASKTEMDLY